MVRHYAIVNLCVVKRMLWHICQGGSRSQKPLADVTISGCKLNNYINYKDNYQIMRYSLVVC